MDQNIQKILEIKNKKMQKAFNQNHVELTRSTIRAKYQLV